MKTVVEEELIAWTAMGPMGSARQIKGGRLEFRYTPEWRAHPDAFPLSLSMPLRAAAYGDEQVRPFLSGLLPDSSEVKEKLGSQFHVSPRNPFALLSHTGEDCPGAVQFIAASRFEQWHATRSEKSNLVWLTDQEIADRMRLLYTDESARRLRSDAGQFSLAGAQLKTAFYQDARTSRWAVPSGEIPTTHIFKPAPADWNGHVINEHFCLTLARELGMATADSEMLLFEEVPVFVSTRYDRMPVGRKVIRIHQEDACQSLAVLPENKYQSDGGPSAADILELIRRSSSAPAEDVQAFLSALVFNWLIGGTDAHAKNYSFLIGSAGQVRLAPLYDVASILAYPDKVAPRKAKLAMKTHTKYHWLQVGRREWEKAAVAWKVPGEQLVEVIAEFIRRTPGAVSRIEEELRAGLPTVPGSGFLRKILRTLSKGLLARCKELRTEF